MKHTNGRARRIDEKNGVTCLFIMLASQSYGYQNVKNGSFFVFSADDAKKLVTVRAKILSPPERSY